jgi:hypothetical protein
MKQLLDRLEEQAGRIKDKNTKIENIFAILGNKDLEIDDLRHKISVLEEEKEAILAEIETPHGHILTEFLSTKRQRVVITLRLPVCRHMELDEVFQHVLENIVQPYFNPFRLDMLQRKNKQVFHVTLIHDMRGEYVNFKALLEDYLASEGEI